MNTEKAQVHIRPATSNDLPVLIQFEQGVISAERPFDNTLDDDPICYYDLPYMLNAPHIRLLVAEINNELIGSGYARIEKSKHYQRHKQHAYLGFMYVVPVHRGQGINKMIIDALKYWSFEQKITELRLDVYTHNISAVKAYEKYGFEKYMMEMKLSCVPAI